MGLFCHMPAASDHQGTDPNTYTRYPILLLKELEGWSAAEIGAAMGWNPKRVYNELYQARCTLIEWQAQVDEEGIER